MDFDDREANEACGVFGIFDDSGVDVRFEAFRGGKALQHRGHKSAGITTSDNEAIHTITGIGEIGNVFPNEESITALKIGNIAASHVRYGTTVEHAAQPLDRGIFTLSHNGHIANIDSFKEHGDIRTDSEIMADVINENMIDGEEIEDTLTYVLPKFEGAFSLVITTKDKLIGVRDNRGMRPLSFAKTPGGYCFASETTAQLNDGWRILREVDPGEMIVVNERGHRSIFPWKSEEIEPRLCSFEYVYFSAPVSELGGREVVAIREEFGRRLAMQDAKDYPGLKPDLVFGVPASGVPAAEGYAQVSGVPYRSGLMKRPSMARTFMEADQKARGARVRQKLVPYLSHVEGKSCLVVDDSIVRGNTTLNLVQMLRDAGAREVHVRISSPPYKWPCFYGMDTPNKDKLIANYMSVEEIRGYINANTLSYLSHEAMLDVIGKEAGICDACMTGNYPTEIPVELK